MSKALKILLVVAGLLVLAFLAFTLLWPEQAMYAF